MLITLFAFYWFVVRTDYVAVFEQLQPSDAAAVVAALDERHIDHRLANGGATILVPSSQADQARLDIAASDLPLQGQIGFELFNQSDMGLTEFAQRINYQRAMQGELARTIMLLDGIETARVHLALPERALFRGNRSRSTAAVTLILSSGSSMSADSISGIQRLVAGSVPDLQLENVTITDKTGRLISSNIQAADSANGSSESQALNQYFSARISRTIASLTPDLDFMVRISTSDRAEVPIGNGRLETPSEPSPPAAGALVQNRRDYAMTVEIVTTSAVEPELRDRLSSAIVDSIQLREDTGDRLIYRVGPTRASPSATAPIAPPTTHQVLNSDFAVPASSLINWQWFVAIFAMVALGGLSIWLLVRRARLATYDDESVDSFVDQLKARLLIAEAGTPNARY